MEEGCRENPSTAFFKNRQKDTLDVKADTIAPQKRDSVPLADEPERETPAPKADSTASAEAASSVTGSVEPVAVSPDSVAVQ